MRNLLLLMVLVAMSAASTSVAQQRLDLPQAGPLTTIERQFNAEKYPASWLTGDWTSVVVETAKAPVSTDYSVALQVPLNLRNGAVHTGLWGFYDYQSNGMSPSAVWVNPTQRTQIHTGNMLALDAESQSPTRRAGYALSTDGGATWQSNREVGGIRTGFPYLRGSSDGTPFIAAHADANADGAIETALWFGSPGSTEFSLIGSMPSETVNGREGGVIWPAFELTSDEENAVIAASYSNPTGEPQAPLHIGVMSFATGGGTWQQPIDSVLSITSGGRYIVARSAGGTIGIVWYRFQTDSTDLTGAWGVYLTESNDNGVTWSTPVGVFTGDMIIDDFMLNGDPDTLSTEQFVDLVYAGETPHVVFMTNINGLYRTESIWHWSPATGADQVIWAHMVPELGAYVMPTGRSQPNMSPISYPTLSVAEDGQHVLIAFQAVAQSLVQGSSGELDSAVWVADSVGFLYFRVWGVGSNNGGDGWSNPWIIQDFAGAGTDSASIEYPSLDEHARLDGSGNFQMNLAFQAKRDPGMYSFTASGSSPGVVVPAYQYFQRTLLAPALFEPRVTSVRDADVVTGLSLAAFPNPNNGRVTLKYSNANAGSGSVTVLNALGEVVRTVMADETLSVGTHTRSLDLSGLPSGAYRIVLNVDGSTVSQSMTIAR